MPRPNRSTTERWLSRQSAKAQRIPSFGYTLNNLALLYRATESYAEAEATGERALRLREQQLGNDHPLVATSLATLASIYHAQGKTEQARPLYRWALAICEQRRGAEHPQPREVRHDATMPGGQDRGDSEQPRGAR